MPVRALQIAVYAPAVAADLRDAPRAARQLGFGGLQVPLAWAGTDLSKLSGTGVRDVRHLLAAHEQPLVAIAVDVGNKGLAPGSDVDRVLARIEAGMQAARGLAAGVVTVDLGPLPQPAREEKPTPTVSAEMAGLILLPPSIAVPPAPPPVRAEATDSAFFTQIDSAMIELGHRADRMSVAIAFRTELSSLAALERALRAADCPWFGVDLDPVALLRDEWEADEAFSRLGPLIRHVRVRDAVGGAGGRTRPAAVGGGDTVWPELLARLDDAGYHGALTVDPTELSDRAAAASRAVETLRKPQ
jgi:sugar phosphate isomerase/epimerase